jgi:hypothetical protein
MADMTVANTILAQYGGRQFQMVTGARDFTGSENSLTFRIPTHRTITHVVTTLTPSDTYTVEYINCRMTKDSFKREVVSIHEDVYFDSLQDIFERETGLYATLYARR